MGAVETTVNVHYIRSAMQKRWGSDHVIVTADGLEIDDCSGTQHIQLYLYACVHAWVLLNVLGS